MRWQAVRWYIDTFSMESRRTGEPRQSFGKLLLSVRNHYCLSSGKFRTCPHHVLGFPNHVRLVRKFFKVFTWLAVSGPPDVRTRTSHQRGIRNPRPPDSFAFCLRYPAYAWRVHIRSDMRPPTASPAPHFPLQWQRYTQEPNLNALGPIQLNSLLPAIPAGAAHISSYPGVPVPRPFDPPPSLAEQTPLPPAFCPQLANNPPD